MQGRDDPLPAGHEADVGAGFKPARAGFRQGVRY